MKVVFLHTLERLTTVWSLYNGSVSMKFTKQSLTLFLMTCSIALLLLLQVFWLTNSYEKANFDLRRQTNMLFRTTVFALRDSSFVRNIESIPADSTTDYDLKKDTVVHGVSGKKNNGKEDGIQVFITSESHKPGDSVSATMLHTLATRIQAAQTHGKNKFFIRMGSDSLSMDSLSHHFKKSLLKENIGAAFKLKHAPIPPPLFDRGKRHINIFRNMEDSVSNHAAIHPFSPTIESDWVRYNPMNRYSFVMTDFRMALLKEIIPQVFFSLFLTLVTILSFVILYRSLQTQHRLMALKNDFISNMTHELKTPIATVSVALEALKNFNGIEDPVRTEEYLTIAQHELNRLTLLTDNVLKATLFEENRIDYRAEAVDLEKIIKQVLNSMKLVFEKNRCTVDFSTTGSDFNVMGSSIHLTNVIYNLLDNAIKYSTPTAIINIVLLDEGDLLRLHVKDYGIGIAPEYVGKIFEKFFRVPAGNIHTIKGYGLGLSYVNNVIVKHRGTIHVTSELNTGTTFDITLPKQAHS